MFPFYSHFPSVREFKVLYRHGLIIFIIFLKCKFCAISLFPLCREGNRGTGKPRAGERRRSWTSGPMTSFRPFLTWAMSSHRPPFTHFSKAISCALNWCRFFSSQWLVAMPYDSWFNSGLFVFEVGVLIPNNLFQLFTSDSSNME